MKREKSGERAFESRSRAKETGKICGVSKTQVLRLKRKHDSHHVDETGIEREISEVSKIWEDHGSSSTTLIKQRSPDYFLAII